MEISLALSAEIGEQVVQGDALGFHGRFNLSRKSRSFGRSRGDDQGLSHPQDVQDRVAIQLELFAQLPGNSQLTPGADFDGLRATVAPIAYSSSSRLV